MDYGNKCIFVENSKIDIHGTPRIKTWTYSVSTIEVGAKTFTV